MTDTLSDRLDKQDEPKIFDIEVEPEASEVFTSEYTEEKPTAKDEPEERKPVKVKSRTPVSSLVRAGVGLGGSFLVSSGTDVGVGRVLQIEAPLLGSKVDQLLAHTWLDDLIQPIVSSAEKVEGFGALIATPILIGMVERNPAIGPLIEGPLREFLKTIILETAPLLKTEQRKERAAVGTIGDTLTTMGIGQVPKDTDPIDFLFGVIFAPPETQAESNGDTA